MIFTLVRVGSSWKVPIGRISWYSELSSWRIRFEHWNSSMVPVKSLEPARVTLRFFELEITSFESAPDMV